MRYLMKHSKHKTTVCHVLRRTNKDVQCLEMAQGACDVK